jgi:hypothetical protein
MDEKARKPVQNAIATGLTALALLLATYVGSYFAFRSPGKFFAFQSGGYVKHRSRVWRVYFYAPIDCLIYGPESDWTRFKRERARAEADNQRIEMENRRERYG